MHRAVSKHHDERITHEVSCRVDASQIIAIRTYIFNHPSFASMLSDTPVSRCVCVFSVASRERGRDLGWAILYRARQTLGRGMEPKRCTLHLMTTTPELPPPSTPAEVRPT